MNAQTKAVTVTEDRPRKASLIEKMASNYQMEPAKFADTIKATCIKGRATNEQFAAFLMVADRYGLNPLLKEVYAFPQDGGIVPIVGVDGWSRIINNHPQFDGMEFRDERNEAGNIVSITCRMFRKDRQHAIEATEYLSECQRNTQPWKQWPTRMLRHKAMIQAARYAFGFTGIFEEDEWERRKEAERAAIPASQSKFASLRQPDYRPRYDEAGEVIDAETGEITDHVADATDVVEGEPVRDINADIEDGEEAAQDASGEPEADPAPDAPEPAQTATSGPENGQSRDAGDQDESARRFYTETLTAITKAANYDTALATFERAKSKPIYLSLTDSQCDRLAEAVQNSGKGKR